MHKSFLPLFIVSLIGVLGASFVAHDKPIYQYIGLVAGIIPLAIYNFFLFRESLLSPAEIDSIYYFGFLITVITLISTAISISSDARAPSMQWILFQFGLGLIATGYALFARLMLMSRSSDHVQMDVLQSTKEMVSSIEKVSAGFDAASYEVAAFSDQFKARLESLLTQSLGVYAKNVEQSAQLSLNRCAASIDSATVNFSNAISMVLEEIHRVKTEAKTMSFSEASDRIKNYSFEIQGAISEITEKVIEASSASAISISEFTTTTRKVQKAALHMSEELKKINQIQSLIDVILGTSEALELLKSSAMVSASSLGKLSVMSTEGSRKLDTEVIGPLTGASVSSGLAQLTQILPANAGKLAVTLAEINAQSLELSKSLVFNRGHLNQLMSSFSSIGDASGNIRFLDSTVKSVAVALSELQNTIGDLRSRLATVSAGTSDKDVSNLDGLYGKREKDIFTPYVFDNKQA